MPKEAAPGAYVRSAKFSELEQVSAAGARAFARDPLFTWFANIKTPIPEQEPKQRAKSTHNLHILMDSLFRAICLIDARPMVVVVPDESGVVNADGSPAERIVAVAEWVQPGASVNGMITVVRAKFHRLTMAWGWTGYQRIDLDYKNAISKRVGEELVRGGLSKTSHWRLEIAYTDPDHEGHGYCGLLLKEIQEFNKNLPTTVEATTPRSRDVYLHYGWTIYDTLTFGKGYVDESGLQSTGEKATGFPVWMMIKWPKVKT
ncbi:hypothetical protein C8J57DRAFT_366586 [Mycena rebaudengoi]|nr:hypothetical protein C8J57DRAFT_366586 [Mycena rebaudengoi]